MPHVEILADVTAEEAAAAIAAIEILLTVEDNGRLRLAPDPWVRAARLEAQGLPVRGNERDSWRIARHV